MGLDLSQGKCYYFYLSRNECWFKKCNKLIFALTLSIRRKFLICCGVSYFLFFVFMFLVCVALFFITIVCEMVSRKMSLEKECLVSEARLTPTLWHTLLAPFVLLLTFYFSSPMTPFHLRLNLSRPCSPGTFTQLLADKIQYFLRGKPIFYESLLPCRKPFMVGWQAEKTELLFGAQDLFIVCFFTFSARILFPRQSFWWKRNWCWALRSSILRDLAESCRSSGSKTGLRSVGLCIKKLRNKMQNLALLKGLW